MSTVVRIGEIGCLVLVLLALLVLPVGGQEKVIDFGGGEKAKAEQASADTAVTAEQPAEAAAESVLDQLVKEEKWRDERARFLAEHYTQSGIARYNELEYESAKAEFEMALQYDPARKEAREYLRKVEAILGLRQPPVIKTYGDQVKIEQEIARQEMKLGFDKAKACFDKGEYNDAVAKFERVRELIRWLGPYTNVEPYKSQTEEFIKKAETERTMQQAKAKEMERKKAEEIVRMNEQYLRDRYDQRIAKLLGKARDLLVECRYKESRDIAINVLELDPMNTEAMKLRDLAFNSRLRNESGETARHTGEETLLSWAQTREAQVPYSETLIYPSNWAEIIKRKIGVIGTETEEEPPWMPDLRNKLETKVSFDFVETPLQDVVTFLQQITNATIILDAKSMSGLASPEVTLKVTEMKLSQALDWILKQVGLQYALKEQAIYIGNAEAVGGDALLKLYDVTDVTLEIRDFPGNLQALRDRVGTSSGGGVSVEGDDPWGGTATEESGGTFTGQTLVDFIKNTIAPGTWADSDLGASDM